VCHLYSITTNQAAIAALFRRMNRYVGNLPSMPGVFPDYPAPVIRNAGDAEKMALNQPLKWGYVKAGRSIVSMRYANIWSPRWLR
jgi:putative SOS response-associated peptidase YedK